jgi:hypothetical protein
LSGNGLKQVGALSPLLLNFALEYATMKVQVNQDDMEKTQQILISADDINLLSKNIDKTYYKEKYRRYIGC